MKLATLFLVMLFATNVFAQGSTSITGVVGHEHAGEVPGALVTLTLESGTQLSTTTDVRGFFQFNNLKPGAYLLEIKARGFAVFTSAVAVAGFSSFFAGAAAVLGFTARE